MLCFCLLSKLLSYVKKKPYKNQLKLVKISSSKILIVIALIITDCDSI